MSESSAVILRQLRHAMFRGLTADRPAIVLVREGVKRLRRQDQTFELTPARIGIIEAGVPYTVENIPPHSRPYVASALLISLETIERLRQDGVAEGTPFSTTNDDRARAAFERAATALSDPLMPARLRENAVREVLLWLAEAGIGFTCRRPSFIDRLRNLVSAEPESSWTVAETGRALAVSEATLRRRLAEAGTTFHDLVADIRMTHALGLLQTTDLPVNRIALDVGYASPSRFAVRFRGRFGIRPSEIRRRQDEQIGT